MKKNLYEEEEYTEAPTRTVATHDYLAPVRSIIWVVFSIIELLLFLRLIFELFGANQVGFVAGLYNITNPIVSPFSGIFPNITLGRVFLDTAAIVAIIVVALISWVITAILNAFSSR